MKVFKNIQNIYFVGVGGIGMSALARFAHLRGISVFGYDKTQTQLTNTIAAEGIQITYKDEVSELPAAISDKNATMVVYTPAIPKNNKILTWFQDKEYTILKRAAFLGAVTRDTLCLAVAGTHGKTTTSAILGHLLASCDMPVTAFLGGIAENYKSNFISKGTEITVVEADEFDRSFLTLSPDIACVTSMDADHLDIYGNEHTLQDAFRAFAALLPKKENLLHKKGLPLHGQAVAIEEDAPFEARNVRIEDGGYVFDLKTPNQVITNLQFFLPGHHNLHNAATALGMALLAGAPAECLPEALSSFKGVERRFSYKIRRDDVVLIDDYAHHPTELNALFQGVSEMYPEERKMIVFQPHLFSRTKDFAEGFAESLALFDQIRLLDIYPARELPMEGVTSQWLQQLVSDHLNEKGRATSEVKCIEKNEIFNELNASNCRIQLMVGAGDIGAEVEEVTKQYTDES